MIAWLKELFGFKVNKHEVLKVPTNQVELIIPKGFWIMGFVIVILLFIISFCVVGYMNPVEHTAQIVNGGY